MLSTVGLLMQGRGNVEEPVPGDELRAIKRYLATGTDNLPCCSCPSGRPS